jgi:hypothetical protein
MQMLYIFTTPVPTLLFIGMGPGTVIGFFHKIAKSIPLEFTIRNGAAQLKFTVGNTDNLPVAPAGPVFNIYFLTDFKRVAPE